MSDALARAGEQMAARHLEGKGYRVLACRLQTPQAEIDLLAERGEWLVLVEVKTRRDTRFGRPGEAVDARKAERLRRAALHLTERDRRYLGRRPRIDVVEVISSDGIEGEIRHLEDVVGG